MTRGRTFLAGLGCLFALAACSSGIGSIDPAQAAAVITPRTSTIPAYTGALDASFSTDAAASMRAQAGSAADALECAGLLYQGGSDDYQQGLSEVRDTPAEALLGWIGSSMSPGSLPESDYHREAERDGRILLSWDAAHGRITIAFVLRRGVTDYRGAVGWGVETWAICDPSEWSAGDARLASQLWRDSAGSPVPYSLVHSFTGPEYCGWQTLRFVILGDVPDNPGRSKTYVQDPTGLIGVDYDPPYQAHATLPGSATDTGWHRDGRELWLASDDAAIYLVAQASPSDVQRWPRLTAGCA